MTTFDLILHFSVILTAFPIYTKFKVSSFKRTRDIRRGFQKGVLDAHMIPFSSILHFFLSTHCLQSLCEI